MEMGDEKRLRRWTDPLEGFIDAGPLQDCLAELDRLRKVEAGRVALFERLDVRDELKYFDQVMTTGELRGFFGGAS